MPIHNIRTALMVSLLLITTVSAFAAPIVEGQPEGNANYALAQNNRDSVAPTMQVASNNDPSADIVNTVTQLQQQVRDLQGQLEVQSHQIDQLTLAQKNIYTQLANKSSTDTTIDAAASALTTVAVNTPPRQSNGVSVKPTAQNTSSTVNNQPVAAVVATPIQNDDQQKTIYDQAYQAITRQQYADASIELNDYLRQYPNGYYAANAHYWLGEMGLVGGDLSSAQTHFQAVVSKFSNSPKVSDAQLKLGYIYYQQGQWAQARQTLQSLIQQYPNTSAATLAIQRIQDMNKQGV